MAAAQDPSAIGAMRNYGPNTKFQEILSYVGGRFARLLMVFVTLVAGGMTANQVAAQGLVVFSPASASFGNVNEGSSKTLSMTIWNDGRAALTITKETVSGSAFSVSGLSVPKTDRAGNVCDRDFEVCAGNIRVVRRIPGADEQRVCNSGVLAVTISRLSPLAEKVLRCMGSLHRWCWREARRRTRR